MARRSVISALSAAWRPVEVEGYSMLPTFVPGEKLWARRLWRTPRVGEVVVARDPQRPGQWIIKRVAQVSAAGIELRGDNSEASTDSRDFGLVERRDVLYVVPHSRRTVKE